MRILDSKNDFFSLPNLTRCERGHLFTLVRLSNSHRVLWYVHHAMEPVVVRCQLTVDKQPPENAQFECDYDYEVDALDAMNRVTPIRFNARRIHIIQDFAFFNILDVFL